MITTSSSLITKGFSLMETHIVYISEPIMYAISEHESFDGSIKEVTKHMEAEINRLPKELTGTEIEQQMRKLVLKYLDNDVLEELEHEYDDDFGIKAIGAFSVKNIVEFLRINPASSIVDDAVVFAY